MLSQNQLRVPCGSGAHLIRNHDRCPRERRNQSTPAPLGVGASLRRSAAASGRRSAARCIRWAGVLDPWRL